MLEQKKYGSLKGRVTTEAIEKKWRYDCGDEFLKRCGEERLKRRMSIKEASVICPATKCYDGL